MSLIIKILHEVIELETKNIITVDVGRQGSLLASKILGRLLLNEGYNVKVSEVYFWSSSE